MKKSILIAIVAVVLIVVIAAAYIGYSGMLNPPAATPTPTPTPTPEVVTQVTVRDSAIMYIATNHVDIASLTANLTWTGGLQQSEGVGSVKYIYLAGNWNVTITNPVVPDPLYTISAIYTDTTNLVTIEWTGTYQNEAITEVSYNYIVPP